MYWSIGGMPELAHLTNEQRRRLLKRCAGWRAYFTLICRSFVLGMVCSVALSMVLLHVLPQGSMGYLFGPLLLLLTVLWYRFFLLRIRSTLRLEVMGAYVGRILPICLECGYDLRSLAPEHCPECGARVRVPGR